LNKYKYTTSFSRFEELLLPEIEERGRELKLIAEIGDGDIVD